MKSQNSSLGLSLTRSSFFVGLPWIGEAYVEFDYATRENRPWLEWERSGSNLVVWVGRTLLMFGR